MAQTSDLLAQLAALEQAPPQDEVTRNQIFLALRQAMMAMESRHDTFYRVASGGLLTSVVKLANELKLLKILTESQTSQNAQSLAKITGAEEGLINRFLRYLAGHQIVKEFTDGSYGSSKATEMLASDGYSNGLSYHFNMEALNWMAIPEYYKKKQYQSPKDATDTPFNLAHKTDLHPFVWGMGQSERFSEFNQYMAVSDHGWGSWLDVFPKEEILANGSNPLLVDVGGSIGHACAELKQRYPSVQRDLIVQDLPMVIAQALQTPGVRNEAYDFFTPQPVHGAKYYYLRQVLHDWPDEICQKILMNQKSAMSSDSSILIDELVLPQHGAHYVASTIDLILMNNAAGIERTEEQWQNLLKSCGLAITARYKYAEVGRSVLVASKADA